MRVFLIMAIVGLCSLIGYGISANYTERKKFFYDYVQFVKNLKNEISFSMEKLPNIIKNLNNEIKNKALNNVLKNYLYILNNKKTINKEDLFKRVNLLNEQEKESIYNFFNRLGKVDMLNQVDALGCSVQIFEEYYTHSKNESEKYCPLYTKMGVLLGLFIALMIA